MGCIAHYVMIQPDFCFLFKYKCLGKIWFEITLQTSMYIVISNYLENVISCAYIAQMGVLHGRKCI